MTTKDKIKKRNSVEYNCMELVCGIVLLYGNSINNLFDLKYIIENNKLEYEKQIRFNTENDLYEYMKDFEKKEKLINNYIINFKNYIESQEDNLLIINNIDTIYISGKKNKHKEINELNSGLCSIETKSDIYIKKKDNTFIGLSVKQSKDATKTNYSVQKILGIEKNKLLTEIKKKYLSDNGFNKFNKLDREKVNKLFYPKNKENPYMNKLKEEIENNKEFIKQFLVNKMFSSSVDYDIYEFNGKELIKLSINKESIITFEEHIPYYYNKKGIERETAKLFYKLVCNNKTYRVEIRWKGNINNSSPQFQIHEE